MSIRLFCGLTEDAISSARPVWATVGWLNGSQAPLVVPVRGSKRERLYGYEEGHHHKNEVRKEGWVRRHRIKVTGELWRSQQGLHQSPFQIPTLARRADWRFKDGSPGYLSENQKEEIANMKDLCSDVNNVLKFLKQKV